MSADLQTEYSLVVGILLNTEQAEAQVNQVWSKVTQVGTDGAFSLGSLPKDVPVSRLKNSRCCTEWSSGKGLVTRVLGWPTASALYPWQTFGPF